LAGIAIVREIFTATNEDSLMHPIVAMSIPEASRDQFQLHNYTISFEPVTDCGYLDCLLCYWEIEILDQPEVLTIGKSRYDPYVLEATKKYRKSRRKRIKELRFIKMTMQTIAVTNATFEVLDNIDYDDSDHFESSIVNTQNKTAAS
jgi:hypothetical protein